MAKQYRVVTLSFVGNQLREPGEIVEYDGEPSSNLEPVNAKVNAGPAPQGSKPQGRDQQPLA